MYNLSFLVNETADSSEIRGLDKRTKAFCERFPEACKKGYPRIGEREDTLRARGKFILTSVVCVEARCWMETWKRVPEVSEGWIRKFQEVA